MSQARGAVPWATLTRIEPLVTNDKRDSAILSTIKSNNNVITSPDFREGDIFGIYSDIFTIGRANCCNLTIRYNKLVSGTHCRIIKDEDNDVFIEDLSTNGTLINKTKKVLKDKLQLTNGDSIHIVHKNANIVDNVGFRFLLLVGGDCEATLTDQTLSDEVETPEKLAVKRAASPDLAESPARKKLNLGHDINEAKDGASGSAAGSAATEQEDDEMGETLLCIICQDIFHDCVSLQPCMHSFCAGCYSEWMHSSSECPCCRLKVDRISKNHLVNNLVESYLKKNPMKKRSESDVRSLNDKNKITYDMLYKQRTALSDSDSSRSSSRSGSPGSSPTQSQSLNPCAASFQPSSILYSRFRTNLAPTHGLPRTVCRQCPRDPPTLVLPPDAGATGGVDSAGATGGVDSAAVVSTDDDGDTEGNDDVCGAINNQPTPAVDNQPGTSADDPVSKPKDEKSTPHAPTYVCRVNQNHILCMCCLQPMPDRRADRIRDPTLPNQECSICHRFFCHNYWTCPKADCLGCLGKFSEMNFGRKCLTGIVLDNQFESNILKDYLDTNDLSVREMLTVCIEKMERREYSSTDSNRGVLTRDTTICYPCGMRNFKELVYMYRRDIDDDDLPAAVRGRDDCHWGKGCRTQKHKAHHAARLNHICDATRT